MLFLFQRQPATEGCPGWGGSLGPLGLSRGPPETAFPPKSGRSGSGEGWKEKRMNHSSLVDGGDEASAFWVQRTER